MDENGHPIVVHLEQILPLLSKEIYSTNLAFLRENSQNGFDAIRIQRYRDSQAKLGERQHNINISITESTVTITDTGNGMTHEDMKNYFWSIGRTGKDTPEAKEAGVVGTFGIGGMANFGVANDLKIISRIVENTPGIVSRASRDHLSTTENCVFYSEEKEMGPRGTTVIAQLLQPVPLSEAKSYLSAIVRYVDFPIEINGELISQDEPPWSDPTKQHSGRSNKIEYEGSSGNVRLTCSVSADLTGSPNVTFSSITVDTNEIPCEGVLQPRNEAISIYRYGFKLADIGLNTQYGLGGHINCNILKPTAGRDTLDAMSLAITQRCIDIGEQAITHLLLITPELTDRNSRLFSYIRQHGLYNQLDLATVRLYGFDGRHPLQEVREQSQSKEILFSRGSDPAVMEVLSKQAKTVVILSDDNNRRRCEEHYLTHLCDAKLIDTRIMATREVPESELTPEQFGFLAGIDAILRIRYLLDSPIVRAAELTEDALVWVPRKKDETLPIIWIDMRNPHVIKLVGFKGSRNYGALLDYFIRDYIFPLIKDAIPSVTSEGFDVLLERLQSRKEVMKINLDDIHILGDFDTSSDIGEVQRVTISSSLSTEISIQRNDIFDANRISEKASEQGLDTPGPVVSDVPPHVQTIIQSLAQMDIEEKILDFSNIKLDLSPWISGFYIALTTEAYGYYRSVIERSPNLEFVWGGYRGSYMFSEHEDTVLYYDIEVATLLKPSDGTEAINGVISFKRKPIFTKENVYLPIPDDFIYYFVPTTEVVRLIVRHELLTPETQSILTG